MTMTMMMHREETKKKKQERTRDTPHVPADGHVIDWTRPLSLSVCEPNQKLAWAGTDEAHTPQTPPALLGLVAADGMMASLLTPTKTDYPRQEGGQEEQQQQQECISKPGMAQRLLLLLLL